MVYGYMLIIYAGKNMFIMNGRVSEMFKLGASKYTGMTLL
jgi:hypothetical protein